MKLTFPLLRSLPFLQVFGGAVLIVGLCFAFICVFNIFSKAALQSDKIEVRKNVDEMRNKLIEKEIPSDQIPGLLSVYKSENAYQVTLKRFVVPSIFALLSLLVAAFGFIVILWSKVKVLNKLNVSRA